ncbi:MAG: IPT/TIG domain-containing protein [Acidobacteriales bacterium]|nr:IPT/TIG domain-containing protein [Terriglobales bacterium]
MFTSRRTLQLTGFTVAMLALALASGGAQAQTYSVVTNLLTTGIISPAPPATIAQGRDGKLYTSGASGGAFNTGGVFSVTPSGTYSTFWSLPSIDLGLDGGVILGTDGAFYGAISQRGVNGNGTVFKLSPAGMETILHSFTDTGDGGNPIYPPVQAADGNYYGLTSGQVFLPPATMYKITPAGVFSTIHTFDATTGTSINAGLIQGTDGNLYGCTVSGGANNSGTIFKITTAGAVTVLHAFAGGSDGSGCSYSLTQGTDGKLYGTAGGGTNNAGLIFRITTAGAYTVLHSINGTTEGFGIRSGVTQATDGNFYGVTQNQGSATNGTLYKITSNGAYTVVHNFDQPTGDVPSSAPFQHTNGLLYGTTLAGGTGINAGNGVVYSLNISAAAFAKLVNTTGKVGSTVEILGQGFTGSTQVSFAGVNATTFSVVSNTYMTATVPVGAKTGTVTITRPSGPLVSSQTFRVTPTITSFTPPSGPVGTAVTINGTGLTQTTKVTFGTIAATTFTVVSDSKITATVPSGAKTGKIGVTSAGGTANSSTSFSVTPTITSFSPTSGPVGTPVMITGTGLTQTTVVTFGGVTASVFTVNSDTQVTATVPAGAITGKIVVTTTGGTATSATNFLRFRK